jgi:transcription elongation factor Elf1
MALRPNATLSSQLDAEAAGFETRLSALKAEKTRIDNMYVDEYDQDSLDTYNAAVDSFNYKNNKYKSDVAAFQIRAEAFDKQIDAYNNYLDAHCTPQ